MSRLAQLQKTKQKTYVAFDLIQGFALDLEYSLMLHIKYYKVSSKMWHNCPKVEKFRSTRGRKS